jgi:hypothetical protein
MSSTKQEKASPGHQLTMVLDSARLRGMKTADREAAIRRLARLLIEAAGIAATEGSADDHV